MIGCRLCDGVDFRAINETKFKTACLSVHLMVPMTRENVTVNAILSGVLRRTCARYPASTQMQRRLAMLYGADVSASFGGLGNCQMLTLEVSMLDTRFVPDGEDVAGECADLLCEMLFRPAREEDGSLFREEDVSHVLRMAKERIICRINDKEDYALHRCLDEMCPDEPLGLEPGGYLEDLPQVTRASLAAAWQELLCRASVNIIMVGAGDHGSVEQRFREEFSQIERDPIDLPVPERKKRAEREREIIERMDVQQCKLMMGFRLPFAEPFDDTVPVRLMSQLLGSGAHSLLFRYVREERSLCYYCSSSFARKHGVLLVSCGLDEAHYGDVREAIKEQIALIAKNAFSDEDFEATRRAALSDLEECKDSLFSMERWYAMQYRDGCVRTPEQTAERYLAVTRQEVAACAAAMTLDTVYLLAPHSQSSEGGACQ